MKKIIAIVLVCMLAFSALSVAAFANGQSTTNVVGYSSERIVAKDLTYVPNIRDYDYVTSTEYKITGPIDMQYLVTLSGFNEVFADITLYLANDIDMTGVEYTPIKFNGVFDGQGHVIDNLVVSTATGGGLFARVQNCVIKNVIIGENCSFTLTESETNAEVMGILAKDMNGQSATITNCYVLGDVVGGKFVGGIVGGMNGGSITDCTFAGSVVSNHNDGAVGGIAGVRAGGSEGAATNNYDVYITNCRNAGTVTTSGRNDTAAAAGGIMGRNYGSRLAARVIIEDCINNGTVTSARPAGAMIGYAGKLVEISDCKNYGTLTGANTGIVGGSVSNMVTETNNTNLMGETDATYNLEQVVFNPPTTDPYVPGQFDNEGGDDDLFGGSDETNTGNTPNNSNNKESKNDTTDTAAPEESTSEEVATEETKGCGSTIGGAVVALACATLAVAVGKKKKD